MSLPDAAHSAALDAPVIKPVWFAWLDILGDPVRANSSGMTLALDNTGDPDLDGHEFVGVPGQLVEVSPVRYRPGGSESVTARLSGIPEVDQDTIDLLADRANWQGRDARLWRLIRNAQDEYQGGVHGFYTGKMVGLTHSGSPEEQTLTITIETYLAVFSAPSNRSYLDQERYDPGDKSARAALAIANGNYGKARTGNGSPGGGGGGRWYRDRLQVDHQ